MDSELDVPAWLPALMRRYINGQLDLDDFVAQVFPLWRDRGWAPYFDPAQLNPQQLVRFQAFETRFAELTLAEVKRRLQGEPPPSA